MPALHSKRVLFLAFALCAAAFFSGCSTNIYRHNTEDVSDEILSLRLAGRWCRTGYETTGSYAVFRDELQFEDDGTFRYSRIWPNLPKPLRRTSVGTLDCLGWKSHPVLAEAQWPC